MYISINKYNIQENKHSKHYYSKWFTKNKPSTINNMNSYNRDEHGSTAARKNILGEIKIIMSAFTAY